MTAVVVDESVERVWEESVLAGLPEPIAGRLLSRAWISEVAAGEVFYHGRWSTDSAMVGMILDGLARTFLRAPDGRQATIRYAGRGALIGAPAALIDRPFLDIDAQAIFDTRILRFPRAAFAALARTESALAWPLARFLAEHMAETQEILAANLFGDVRSRVARHLLDLAVDEGPELVVTATHQDVADAIGSVREVVSRAIKRLQDERVVERVGAVMVIRAPGELHSIAGGAQLPSNAPQTISTGGPI